MSNSLNNLIAQGPQTPVAYQQNYDAGRQNALAMQGQQQSMANNQQAMQQRNALFQREEQQATMEQMRGDVTGALASIVTAPAEQRPQVYQQMVTELKSRHGQKLAQIPDQYPGDEAITSAMSQFFPPDVQARLIERHFAPKQQGLTNVAPGGVVFDQDTRKPVYTAPREAPPQAPDRTLVSVIGDDGQAVLVPRSQAAGRRPAQAKSGAAMSASAQKELFEADDVANSAKNAIDILNSIIAQDPVSKKSQNDLAFEGGTAGFRKGVMGFVPGEYEGENASVDLQNKVTGQALESLRAIFGGMPTEGERKILIELQGSINQKASQRELIFKRAIGLAEKRMKFAQEKAKSLREGTYFGAGVNAGGGEVNPQDILDAADAILSGQ